MDWVSFIIRAVTLFQIVKVIIDKLSFVNIQIVFRFKVIFFDNMFKGKNLQNDLLRSSK